MLSAGPACSRGPIGPSRIAPRGRPNLLRKERFGALFYDRASAEFSAVPPALSRLLAAAVGRSVIDAYAEDDHGLAPEALAIEVLRLRAAGVLDARDRLNARLVEAPREHGALIGPLVTHLQLTRACNLRCEHCYVDVMAKPSPDELSTAELGALFAELEALGSPVVVMAGGEPMLRPDLFELLVLADRHGIDGWLCTNGTMIDAASAARLARSGLRGISVSLDGPDPETHAILRGPRQFERTLLGVEALLAAGTEDVQLRVTVTPHNAATLLGFAPLARSLGVHKVVFKPFRASGLASEAARLTIEKPDYDRAMAALVAAWPTDVPADFGDGLPTRPPAWTGVIPAFGCVGGTTSVTITYDAKVTGCGAVLGPTEWTLRDASFADCWRRAPGVTSWRNLAGNDECRACGNFARCGGGCRARATAAGRTIDEPDPWSYCSEERPRSRLPVLMG